MVVALNEYEIGYLPVPKAGCTSVKTALTRAMGLDRTTRRKILANPDAVHAILPTLRFRAQRFDDYANWFRFTVVRDPVARLLAVYTDRVLKRGELRNSANLRRGRVVLPVDPDPDFFFERLESYKLAASTIKHHAMKQVVYTGEHLARFDRVYRLDDLEELGRDLTAMTGRDLHMPRLNVSDVHLSYHDLGPAAQHVVRDYTMDDYRAFGGLFTPPWD